MRIHKKAYEAGKYFREIKEKLNITEVPT